MFLKLATTWKHDQNWGSEHKEGGQSQDLLICCVETCCWLQLVLIICHAVSIKSNSHIPKDRIVGQEAQTIHLAFVSWLH